MSIICIDHTIVTDFVFPPIPVRCCDWAAYTDNYDGADDAGPQLIGYGATEAQAVDALIERIAEDMEIDAIDTPRTPK